MWRRVLGDEIHDFLTTTGRGAVVVKTKSQHSKFCKTNIIKLPNCNYPNTNPLHRTPPPILTYDHSSSAFVPSIRAAETL
ncbi:hypothetical protein L1987_43639 [Smallanthus sonchifolius]|uniref:Uncharacterized protein n=1 Tax=Smallanthus sonchifolius TaxID=185202 RepID=A0ACB9GLN3_9ASTR|nr:hypothetical protein L1987_43639 [Smallanthus sonchifolius]